MTFKDSISIFARQTRAPLLCLLLWSSADAENYTAAPPEASYEDLQSYLSLALANNPQLAAFEQRYEAALQRIPQASALPEPMFQVTSFVESIQTRTGPQENATDDGVIMSTYIAQQLEKHPPDSASTIR